MQSEILRVRRVVPLTADSRTVVEQHKCYTADISSLDLLVDVHQDNSHDSQLIFKKNDERMLNYLAVVLRARSLGMCIAAQL